jgi:peptidoglycan-N-acetylglucosamine deacetylase
MVHRTPFFLPLLYPSLRWRMPADKKELYLTFDDGPVPGPTEFVLEQLQKRSSKATFFCIGDNVSKHPTVFKMIVDEGHTVGNHTFNHLKGWQTDLETYVENIDECDKAIIASWQLPADSYRHVNYFRPPYGRITRNQTKALADKKIVMWDVLTRDYDASLSPESCLKGSLGAVRNGSIIVFHDSIKAEKNLRYALPRFMDACIAQGFTFKAMV